MPQPDYNASNDTQTIGLGLTQISNACPNPLTPPPEQHEHYGSVRLPNENQLRVISALSADNTAAAMAQSQEDSVYISPAPSIDEIQNGFRTEDKDRVEVAHQEYRDASKASMMVRSHETDDMSEQSSSNPPTPVVPAPLSMLRHVKSVSSPAQYLTNIVSRVHNLDESQRSGCNEGGMIGIEDEARSRGLAPVDLLFNHATTTKSSDFSNRRLLPEYPSHVFQSFSRYSGTQQSDRQIYNVDVTILTIDIAQCTMTGYLLIRGLTPEHDTLQTYFTGEIIGGPPVLSEENQYYTFRTANPSWGATEKTDLTHWARFPAWRSLSSHAKRDINFEYPTDGGNWWEQDNIFMRWKEHFLVPDHKTKSIAGASFEGFYYICLNQVQGRISGIYYHSKSEKYQQLELKHEGPPDIFDRGITPCVEFR